MKAQCSTYQYYREHSPQPIPGDQEFCFLPSIPIQTFETNNCLRDRKCSHEYIHRRPDHGHGNPARFVSSPVPTAETHPWLHLWHGRFRHRRGHPPSNLLSGAFSDIICLHELVLPRGFRCRICYNPTGHLGLPERDVSHHSEIHESNTHQAYQLAHSGSAPNVQLATA